MEKLEKNHDDRGDNSQNVGNYVNLETIANQEGDYASERSEIEKSVGKKTNEGETERNLSVNSKP